VNGLTRNNPPQVIKTKLLNSRLSNMKVRAVDWVKAAPEKADWSVRSSHGA
jgi:hypothetical protein